MINSRNGGTRNARTNGARAPANQIEPHGRITSAGVRCRRRERPRRSETSAMRCVTWYVCTCDTVDKHATFCRPKRDCRKLPRGGMLPAWFYDYYVHNGKTSHVNVKRGDATDSTGGMTPKLFIPVVFVLGIVIAVISTFLSKYIGGLSTDSTGESQLIYLPFQREIASFMLPTVSGNLQQELLYF